MYARTTATTPQLRPRGRRVCGIGDYWRMGPTSPSWSVSMMSAELCPGRATSAAGRPAPDASNKAMGRFCSRPPESPSAHTASSFRRSLIAPRR